MRHARRRSLFAVGLIWASVAGCSGASSSAAPDASAASSSGAASPTIAAAPAPSLAASPAVSAAPAPSTAATAVVVTANVTLEHVAFKPASLTVAAGTTVVWSNQDSIPHTVTADDASFDSGHLDGNKSFRQTFSKAGTYAYHCSIHSGMTGTVVVK